MNMEMEMICTANILIVQFGILLLKIFKWPAEKNLSSATMESCEPSFVRAGGERRKEVSGMQCQ